MLGAWEVDIWARKLLYGVEHVEDSENLKKIAIPRFEKNVLKVGKTHFRLSLEYFALPEALTMALMVTASGASSVTVRDRPNNVLGVEWEVGVAKSKNRVAAIFLLPVWPLELPRRTFLANMASACPLKGSTPLN